MSFSADWLSLRAEADARARDAALLRAAAAWAGARPEAPAADLGAGTGATLRALAPLAPGLRWRLIDSDPVLLARARETAAALGARAETVEADLAAEPDSVLGAATAERPALIAASAFFDLVSEDWTRRLAALARRAGAAVYAALTYDGREDWAPPHPGDAAALDAFRADMTRDKGFGPALGPRAADALAAALKAEGYAVRAADSAWALEAPRDAALIAALAEGHARATGAPDDWLAARRAARRVHIGHTDLFATPPE